MPLFISAEESTFIIIFESFDSKISDCPIDGKPIINELKSMANIYFINYLNNHRYKKDENTQIKETHSSWGPILQGSFYLDDTQVKEFMELYCNAIKNGVALVEIK